MSIHEEIIMEIIDILINKDLIDPNSYTIEELELLFSEVFIDFSRNINKFK